MKISRTERGFEIVMHEAYPPGYGDETLLRQSSAIGDYDNSMTCPGSSFLWVGENHHLNREEVKQLIDLMSNWLETGSLEG